MNRLLHNDASESRGRKSGKRRRHMAPDPELDDLAEILGSINGILEGGQDLQNTEARRHIERLREEQRLQRELTEIFDY